MTEEEILVARELAAAIKALADALTPKLGGFGGLPLFAVRCECNCNRHQPYCGPMSGAGNAG